MAQIQLGPLMLSSYAFFALFGAFACLIYGWLCIPKAQVCLSFVLCRNRRIGRS